MSEVTAPDPVPDLPTVKVSGVRPKVAVTELSWPIGTVHEPVPEHAPDQPRKVEPVAGVSVNVTDVPYAKSWEQVAPQLIPDGLEPTEPEPLPDLVTVNEYVAAGQTSIAAFCVPH
jgi:hypothetical protein